MRPDPGPAVPTAGQRRTVAIATIYGQFSLVLAFPLLTRLYPAGEFASYQLAFSVAVVLQSALAGGVEFVIPVTDSPAELRRLLRRAFVTGLCITVVGAVLCLALWLDGRGDLAAAVIGGWVVATATTLATLDNAQLIRRSDSARLVSRNVLSGSLCLVVQIGGGFVSDSFWVLIGAVGLARVASVLVIRTPRRETHVQPSVTGTPSPLTGGQSVCWLLGVAASNAAVQLPVFLVAATSSATEAAQFAIAIRLVSLMTTVLGAGLSQSFLLHISALIRADSPDTLDFISRTEHRLTVTGLGASLLLALTAWWTVPLLLGEAWHQAGLLSTILALPYGLQLVNRILTPLHTLMGSSRLNLQFQVARLVSLGTVLLVGNALGLSTIALGVTLAVATAVFAVGYSTLTLSRAHATFAVQPA